MAAVSPTEKYLSAYAEPEIRYEALLTGKWDHVVAVPALGEADTFPHFWQSVIDSRRNTPQLSVLVIVVVNAREAATAEAHESNRCLWNALSSLAEPRVHSRDFVWGERDGVGLVAVNRFENGYHLAPKQGVGQARKIGCDLALALIAKGKVRSREIDITDADARLPEDFWQEPGAPSSFAGLNKNRPVVGLHDFVHVPVAGYERAIAEYDAFLRYYEKGLADAGSPYAFQTVGSTLRVDAAAYAEVRGFPDREAGEDFYLLNKLAKVGGVYSTGKRLTLSGRPSWRVPFGTGQKVNWLGQEFRAGREYPIYDPRVFEKLETWLTALAAWAERPDDTQLRNHVAELWTIGELLGVEQALEAARKSRKDSAARLRHLHEWFDAFRTLRFVHELTDRDLPRISFQTVVSSSR